MATSTPLKPEVDTLTQAVDDLIHKACAPYEALVVRKEERKWLANFYTTTPYNPYPSVTVKVILEMGSSGGCSQDNITILPEGLTFPVPLRNVILPKLISREFGRYAYVDEDTKVHSNQAK